MAEIIDISVPIRDGMVHYEGNPGIHIERVQRIADGATANVSRIDFGAHTATHVDAQVHFLDDGAGAEALPLEPLVGPADVVDATDVQKTLDADALNRLDIPDDAKRILFKTRNSRLWASDEFTRDFVRLDGSGAQWLIDRGVELVGIDYLSIGDEDAHRLLLSTGVVAVEGVNLGEVDPGRYDLVCLPLRVVGSDGAPARAVLMRDA
jgi:arylformamidase